MALSAFELCEETFGMSRDDLESIIAFLPEVPISTNEGFDYKHLYFIASHDFQVASF